MHHAYGELLHWVCHAIGNCQDLEFYNSTDSNMDGGRGSKILPSESNIQEFYIADEDEEAMIRRDEKDLDGSSIHELFGEWRLTPTAPTLCVHPRRSESTGESAAQKADLQQRTGLLDVLGDLRTRSVSEKVEACPTRRPNKSQFPSPQPSQGKSGKAKGLQSKAAPRSNAADSASASAAQKTQKTPLAPQSPAEAHGMRLAHDAAKLLQASNHQEPRSRNSQGPSYEEPKVKAAQRSRSASPRLAGSGSPSLTPSSDAPTVAAGKKANNFYATPAVPQLQSGPKSRTPQHSGLKSTTRGNDRSTQHANLSCSTLHKSAASSVPAKAACKRSASASPKQQVGSRATDRVGHVVSDSSCRQSNPIMSTTPCNTTARHRCSSATGMLGDAQAGAHSQINGQNTSPSASPGGQVQSLQPGPPPIQMQGARTQIQAPHVLTSCPQVTQHSVLVPGGVGRRHPGSITHLPHQSRTESSSPS
eukprot:gnl/MRDRNA2_/MRDRNA2_99076_c0_seq1.p1 gnl/MRDRNA2_/MRDRNA2_99076_c0~~gnl/MRDRNA2_/MRDRNA2_99076_c0_seq1.p1  ORF type:complete len:538 (+),score=93.94 gnl/MRDRNA2_/MRDRNA2_99076_c0_seq1:187-1614(+)